MHHQDGIRTVLTFDARRGSRVLGTGVDLAAPDGVLG